jgi:hypothetical protein
VESSVSTLTDLLTRAEFLTGVGAGIVALGILYAFGPLRNARAGGLWAWLLAGAGVVWIHFQVGRRLSLVLALAVLGVGGWLLDRTRGRTDDAAWKVVAWVSILLGAYMFSARSGLPAIGWLRIAAPALAVVSALAIRRWGDAYRPQHLGLLFAISAFGIWTTVPDTEGARMLLGAALPMALGTLNTIGGWARGGGAFALTGLATWIVALGGETRQASIVGGWACLGLLVAVPLILPNRSIAHLNPWVVIAGHTGVVVIAARVIGLQESLAVALVGVSILILAVVTAVAVLGRKAHEP